MASEFPNLYSLDVVFFEGGKRTQDTLYWANREELVDLIEEMREPMTGRVTGWSEFDVDLLVERLTARLATTPWEGKPGVRAK